MLGPATTSPGCERLEKRRAAGSRSPSAASAAGTPSARRIRCPSRSRTAIAFGLRVERSPGRRRLRSRPSPDRARRAVPVGSAALPAAGREQRDEREHDGDASPADAALRASSGRREYGRNRRRCAMIGAGWRASSRPEEANELLPQVRPLVEGDGAGAAASSSTPRRRTGQSEPSGRRERRAPRSAGGPRHTRGGRGAQRAARPRGRRARRAGRARQGRGERPRRLPVAARRARSSCSAGSSARSGSPTGTASTTASRADCRSSPLRPKELRALCRTRTGCLRIRCFWLPTCTSGTAFWHRAVTVAVVVVVALVVAKIADRAMARRDLDAASTTRYRVLRRSIVLSIVVVGRPLGAARHPGGARRRGRDPRLGRGDRDRRRLRRAVDALQLRRRAS